MPRAAKAGGGACVAPLAGARLADARAARRNAAAALRRTAVLDAARSAFLELGLEGASLREIARRAGYTPGAIYSYFDSKEAVYGALLGESLERLNAHVAAAAPADAHPGGAAPARHRRAAPGRADAAAVPVGATPPGREATDAAAAPRRRTPAARRAATRAAVCAAALAFFGFYLAHPRDLDLGFYLFQGMQPRGLGPDLDALLNARLADALRPVQDGLAALGLDAADARAETTALFAHAVGLLVLGHTGRIRMFGQRAETLFARYLDALVARAGALPHPPARSRTAPRGRPQDAPS